MRDLMVAAREVQGSFLTEDGFRIAAVGAALRTRSGRIYTGVSLEMACGIGFCAEHSAIAEMLKDRETEIEAMLAVSAESVLPPCGRCRELVLQLNPANARTEVAISLECSMPMSDLLQHRWY